MSFCALESLPTPWLAAAAAWEDATDSWRYARDLIREAQGGVDLALSTAARPWTGALPDAFRVDLRITNAGPWAKIETAIRDLAASTAFAAMENAFDEGSQPAYEQARNELLATLRPARDALATAWTDLHTFIKGKLDLVRGHGGKLRNTLSKAAENAWEEFGKQLDALDQLADLEAFQSQLRSTLQGVDQQWDGALQRAEDAALTAIEPATCEAFFASAKDYLDYLNKILAAGRLTDWIEDTLNQLPTSAEVQRQLQALERELAEAAQGLLERAAAEGGAVLERLAEPVAAAGDSVLRLVRAFGEAPRVPSLDFRLPDASGITDRLAGIGYYFQDLVGKVPLPHVDITPVLARTNQLGKDLLNPLEIKLPTTQLFDRFRPTDLLANFDLRKVFPNFAGLQLDDLFEGLKLPDGARDRIKITHGADPQSFRGWVQIEVDQAIQSAGDGIHLCRFGHAGERRTLQGGLSHRRRRGAAAAAGRGYNARRSRSAGALR